MQNHSDEYYFITYKSAPNRPQLGPDEDTNALKFENEDVTSGLRRPLVFFNIAAELSPKENFKSPPPDIIFHGSNIAVTEKIYERLSEIEIPNLILQPAIFIDDKEAWHENYWYLTFTRSFDCWSRENSLYDPDPIEMNGKEFFSIYNYKLNNELLSNTKLNDRLLFRLGGDLGWPIVVHKSIAKIFRTESMDGAVLVPIKDYGVNFYH